MTSYFVPASFLAFRIVSGRLCALADRHRTVSIRGSPVSLEATFIPAYSRFSEESDGMGLCDCVLPENIPDTRTVES